MTIVKISGIVKLGRVNDFKVDIPPTPYVGVRDGYIEHKKTITEGGRGLKNWVKVAIVLALIAFIFANPLTRAIVIFILPLGSGVDDFIEMIALVLLAILLLVKIKKNWRKIIEWFNS